MVKHFYVKFDDPSRIGLRYRAEKQTNTQTAVKTTPGD